MSNDQKPDNASDTAKGNQPVSPEAIIPSQEPSEKPAGKNPNEKKGFFENWKYEIEFAGFVGLVFYCIINYLEWRTFDSERVTMEREFQANQKATERQIDEMRNSRILDERAWVVAETFRIISPTNNFAFQYVFSLKNTGRTPARNIQISSAFGNISLDAIPETDIFKPIDSKHGGLLAPGSEEQMLPETISEDNIKKIEAGESFFYFGTVWYDDVFRKRHWSQFCFQIEGKTTMVTNIVKDEILVSPSIVITSGEMWKHNSCDDVETNQIN